MYLSPLRRLSAKDCKVYGFCSIYWRSCIGETARWPARVPRSTTLEAFEVRSRMRFSFAPPRPTAMRQLLSILALLVGSVLSTGARQPHELVAIRDPVSQQCRHLALRELAQFRGLSDDGYAARKALDTGEERVQLVHYDKSYLWAYAESLCGKRDSWNFHVIVQVEPLAEQASQIVLQPSTISSYRTEVPPLEVEPLITSGDSRNRIDLVFFADGCEYAKQPCGSCDGD